MLMKDHETLEDMVRLILISMNLYFVDSQQLIQLHKTLDNLFQDQITFARVYYFD